MDRPLPQRDSRRPGDTWKTRIQCIAVVLIFATAGGVMLAVSSDPFDGSWFRSGCDSLANTLPDHDMGVISAVSAGGGVGGPHTTRGMQGELVVQEGWANDTLEEVLVKQYPSFAEYALEISKQDLASLPVPVVKLEGNLPALSIPVITIIGVQKGGTTNLRQNLLTHPMVWGKMHEVHFFDQTPSEYPDVGHWEGDGLHKDIGIDAAGQILSEYAEACRTKAKRYYQRRSGELRTDRIIVDSSPRYCFNPLVPYRISMVRPGAKFVIVLRDPTSRYFSHLRMEMCRKNKNPLFSSTKEKLDNKFHSAGGAKDYLARADEAYEPYTALCRGENASASDLSKCYQALELYNPIYRGLYADQLERWFRAFDRSQIMIVDASDMLADFVAVVTAVAEFSGLPAHTFKYNPSREHKTGCLARDQKFHNNYFVDGGRYDQMVEEEELLREWYRPHNKRLYRLLGREFTWE